MPGPRVSTTPYIFNAIWPGFAIWVLVAIERIWGITLQRALIFKFEPVKVEDADFFPIWAAIAVTLIAPPISYLFYRKAIAVAKRGVFVDGVVLEIGRKFHGMRDVTFTYEFNGKSFKRRKSFEADDIKYLKIGGPIDLLIDSRRPKTSYLRSIMLVQDHQESTHKETSNPKKQASNSCPHTVDLEL